VLREHDQSFRYLGIILDFLGTMLGLYLAILVRNEILGPYVAPGFIRGQVAASSLAIHFVLLPLLVVLWARSQRLYDSLRTQTLGQLLPRLALAIFGSGALGMIVGFIVDAQGTTTDGLSRLVLLIFPFTTLAVLGAKHVVVRKFLQRARGRGFNWRTLALVGNQTDVQQMVELINASPQWGFRINGILQWTSAEELPSGTPYAPVARDHTRVPKPNLPVTTQYFDDFSQLIQYCRILPLDEVVLVSHDRPLESLSELFEACEEMGIRTRLAVQFFRNSIAKPRLDQFEHTNLVTWSPAPDSSLPLLIKHVFDRVAAALFLVIFSPLMLAVAIAVKLSSQNWNDPIFFGQTRSGLNGRPFTMWKFRTMVVNADQLVDALKDQNEMGGPVFKIKQDPRVTPLGRWLRRLSLDELPQLYNVVIGDMSLVGPRPPLPKEVALYDRWQRRRLSMKPGITCLWQVSGRNNLPFETWMKLDLEYIDNWSLWLDFKILLRTVYAVTTGHGAM
jgi:exopolysaccharide biosynthesis polyprenyl glycosylphosphotransferase